VSERFGLSEEERHVLEHSVVDLDRRGRRLYHRSIEPRLGEFRRFVRQLFERDRQARGADAAREWATAIGLGIVGKGYASVCDLLAMDAVGRRPVSEVVRAARGSPLF
jgi:hypothetical protein